MQIETVDITDLQPDPKNARKHDETNLKAIKASLSEFGQRKPIVITSKNVVVAGNGTLAAARSLGWDAIDAVRVPADWTANQIKAFALADNRTAELADWDRDILSTQLVELQTDGWDISLIGFDVTDLPTKPADENDDIIPEPPAEPISKLGDVWQLGKHRVMCGDSTDASTIAKLMNGNKADMVFTDPPYGVNYQSNMRTKSAKFDIIANDDVLLDIAPIISANSQGFVFVWTSWKVIDKWIAKLADFGYPTNIIVWNKGGGYIGDLEKTFGSDYELALVWHNKAKLTDKRIGSVWGVNKDQSSDYLHPTQKPTALATMAIQHTTISNQIVLDIFGGSGSTLIACEQTNRTCYMMELDPQYVDVIIKRWETLTGQTAVLQDN